MCLMVPVLQTSQSQGMSRTSCSELTPQAVLHGQRDQHMLDGVEHAVRGQQVLWGLPGSHVAASLSSSQGLPHPGSFPLFLAPP